MTSSSQVRFGGLEHRGILLGLNGFQLGNVAAALTVVIAAEYSGGILAVAVSAPVWGLLCALGLVVVSGRSALVWLPLLGSWALRRTMGRATSLLNPTTRVRREVLALPGCGSDLTLVSSRTGQGFFHDRRDRTLTAVVQVGGTGFALASSDSQDQRVAGWGRVLASLCQQPSVVRVQVLHRTIPAPVSSVRAWWSTQLTSAWAARVVADLMAQVDHDADCVDVLIAVAIKAPASRRGRLPDTALATVVEQIAALEDAMRSAQLTVHGPLTVRQLRTVLRTSYDPFAARHHTPAPEMVAEQDRDNRCDSSTWGPVGVQEQWRSVTTDTAAHAVYWISEWPRSTTHAGFLQPLLLSPGARRTFTLIAEPLGTSKALREIRRAKVEHVADAAQRARIGQVEDETTRAEAADLLRREQDLVAGHGDLQFTGLITVTTSTEADLPAACAATEAAAAQAMCELRLLVGQQAVAHTVACAPIARSLR